MYRCYLFVEEFCKHSRGIDDVCVEWGNEGKSGNITSHLASPVTMNLRKTVKKTKTADGCMLETAGWVGWKVTC